MTEITTEICLARVAADEDRVKAWAFIDAGLARRNAAAAPPGALHGLPVGVKDIFDTADMPTENGTVLDAGRRPEADAETIRRLRAAGAVIVGKTVSTELAVYAPGKTTNPHDPTRSPGGSSSGSAAAVAAGMVPVALGTQTNGSVVRPAGYCGVIGFKPTQGTIPGEGILCQCPSLDQVGVFAASLEDAARVAGVLMDGAPDLASALVRPLGKAPRFAFVRSPVWDKAEGSVREAFPAFAARLGAPETELPPAFDAAVGIHRAIMLSEMAHNYRAYFARGAERLSATLRGMFEEGRAITAVEYLAARAAVPGLIDAIAPLFDTVDAIVTPATTGEAPKGLETTGSPIFCTLWTLCGLPAVTLPLLKGPEGMPLGVQLVGRRGGDAELLAVAQWLMAHQPRE